MECVRTCPTGSLTKIPKSEVVLGTVVIVQDICLAWLDTRRCDLCMRACRAKAITMQDRRYPVIDNSKCQNCGRCMLRCPEPGALILDPKGAMRYEPDPGLVHLKLQDRLGPHEFAQPSYGEWFRARLDSLAKHYGIKK
jgi:ferredoxin